MSLEYITDRCDLLRSDAVALLQAVRTHSPEVYAAVREASASVDLVRPFREALYTQARGLFGEERALQLQVLGRLRLDRVRCVWSAFYSVYGWVDPVEAIERTIADLLRAIRGWRVDPTVQDVLDLQARVDVAKHGYDTCALMFSLERRMEQADLGHRWAVVKEGLDLLAAYS